ncbi:MAG: Beta-galactosidase C-terminal domain, partial [Lachnospiraceae bacterium]|nr:Beta-galactosidase C-terminal domain [Lachnospiraceae bacterium]
EFYLNMNEESVTIENVSGRELLSDKICGGSITLEKYAISVVEIDM